MQDKKTDFYNSLKEIHSLMKRMGEVVCDPMEMAAYCSAYMLPVVINEGLIKSYDIDQVIEYISTAFGLKNLDTNKITFYDIKGEEAPDTIRRGYGENGTDLIIIRLRNREDKRPVIEQYMKKYGWVLSRVDEEPVKGFSLTFEKKFNEYFYNKQLKRITNRLYHVTDKSNLERIKKRGLVTKEKKDSVGLMHDERLYLFINEPEEVNINLTANVTPSILKIDLDKLPDSVRFYFDPRVENAFYTFENIPPEAIVFET